MEHELRLNQPADSWLDAFPTGNGILGAMPFGCPDTEKILINHERLYRGKGRYRDLDDVSHKLAEVREKFFSADMFEAGTFANETLGGSGGILKQGDDPIPNRVDPFQPIGYVHVGLGHEVQQGTYLRTLDLKNAIASCHYSALDGMDVDTHVISHFSLPIIVMQIENSKPMSRKPEVSLSREADPECHIEHGGVESYTWMTGRFSEGILFTLMTRSVASENGLTILITAATSVEEPYPFETCRNRLDTCHENWDALFSSHLRGYRGLYDRVSVNLGALRIGGPKDVPTNERMARMQSGDSDPGLFELAYNYGRYLLISSSQPGGLPANLQGIWSEDLHPPWECDLHHDINLQMNYWIADSANLSECAEPLFDHIERFVPHARIAAKKLYGCGGVWFPIQTDPWGRATPESRGWDTWTGAAAWLAQHLWWRYEYTLDSGFLEQRTYPFLKEVATFYEDYLIEDPREESPFRGMLVTVPSQSPENYFDGGTRPVSLCIGATMDFEFIREILGHAIEASRILGVDEAERARWAGIVEKLPTLQIGSHGQLQEWLEDLPEGEIHHRHLSHLVGVFPGEHITLESTPDLVKAVEVTLDRRGRAGGQANGWSGAWAACIWARLERGNLAGECLRRLVSEHNHPNMLNGNAGGPSERNLFQIDGNFGAAAAVSEILLQCYDGWIKVLPALPDDISEGSFHGLRGKGGFSVSAAWQNRRLRKLTVVSELGQQCKIVLPGEENVRIECRGNVIPFTTTRPGRIVFSTERGREYIITPLA